MKQNVTMADMLSPTEQPIGGEKFVAKTSETQPQHLDQLTVNKLQELFNPSLQPEPMKTRVGFAEDELKPIVGPEVQTAIREWFMANQPKLETGLNPVDWGSLYNKLGAEIAARELIAETLLNEPQINGLVQQSESSSIQPLGEFRPYDKPFNRRGYTTIGPINPMVLSKGYRSRTYEMPLSDANSNFAIDSDTARLDEIPQPDHPTSAWRYLMIRLSDPFKSQGKVERPAISQDSLDDFKRKWFTDNWDLLKPDGGVDWKPALDRIDTEIEMSSLIAKYLVSTEPELKGAIEPLNKKRNIWETWLGVPTKTEDVVIENGHWNPSERDDGETLGVYALPDVDGFQDRYVLKKDGAVFKHRDRMVDKQWLIDVPKRVGTGEILSETQEDGTVINKLKLKSITKNDPLSTEVKTNDQQGSEYTTPGIK